MSEFQSSISCSSSSSLHVLHLNTKKKEYNVNRKSIPPTAFLTLRAKQNKKGVYEPPGIFFQNWMIDHSTTFFHNPMIKIRRWITFEQLLIFVSADTDRVIINPPTATRYTPPPFSSRVSFQTLTNTGGYNTHFLLLYFLHVLLPIWWHFLVCSMNSSLFFSPYIRLFLQV